MARTPQIRVSFAADAAYLARLQQAIERDDTRPAEWRAKAIGLLQDLTVLFMQAPHKQG